MSKIVSFRPEEEVPKVWSAYHCIRVTVFYDSGNSEECLWTERDYKRNKLSLKIGNVAGDRAEELEKDLNDLLSVVYNEGICDAEEDESL